jgi:hypothetical protein
MDEPTAALSRPDAVRLHEIIRGLAGSGTTIVLVSHFLREVLDLAQEVTILRDGRVVRTAHAADETEQSLLNAMLGRSLGATFPAKRPAGGEAPVVLSVAGSVRGRGEQRLAGGAGRRDRRAGRPGRCGPHRTRPRGAGGQSRCGGNRQRRRRPRARRRSTERAWRPPAAARIHPACPGRRARDDPGVAPGAGPPPPGAR